MEKVLKKLPETSEEFWKLAEELAVTPEGAVAACIAALKLMAMDAEEGKRALMAICPEAAASTTRLAVEQLGRAPWIADSYFSGATPENGYTPPREKVVSMSTNPYSGTREEGSVKYFVQCSGADSPRPVTVRRREDGSWYPWEWSSLIVGIVEPG